MTSPRNANAILAVILTGYLMIVLDLSIIFTGLPEIGRTMGMDAVRLSWVHNAYLLGFGGLLLFTARLGDLRGRKRMLRIGIAVFTVASFAVGVAASSAMLIAARGLQGVGAAILAPSILSILTASFAEGADRTKALAWYSMVAGAGSSLGLVLGGIFAGLLSWRVGFLMNVPVGVVLWIAANRIIPPETVRSGKLDVMGAITSSAGMAVLVAGIVRAADHGWQDPSVALLTAIAVVILALFLRIEGRNANPLLPLTLFAEPTRVAAYLGRMMFIGPAVAFFYFGTQLMQSVLGFSPVIAGVGFLPMTIVTFATALVLPRITDRMGHGAVLVVAFVFMAAGLYWLGLIGDSPDYWTDLALPMVLVGLGNGGALSPLTTFGVYRVSETDQGAASGLVNAAHQLGGSIGLSVLVVVFASAQGTSLSGQIAAVFHAAAFASLAGAVLTLLFILPVERKARLA